MTRSAWPAERIVAAARAGDQASLTELVAGSHPHVRRFAFALCANSHDAEDAAQEAMIILYRRISTLRTAGALSSWLFRVVANECLRRGRAMLRPEPDITGRNAPSAEDEALRRWEAERMASAIAALPADQRAVLILRDLHNLPGRRVAEALGLSLAAMKSRLHRGRLAVRDRLIGPAVSDGRRPDRRGSGRGG
ncbi:RNA polymerase sigma factor [Actinoplanes sp. NPDC049265]|uniref:RNA polymerase sigma factor n=1 Tax=Actinoplanes sp. NPDC049265 TaxID=3363902 RepID=UPI00371F2AD4